MSDFNSTHNRAVWVDIPVVDLDRAREFYSSVLAIPVHKETFGEFTFCVLDHKDGNGGCLITRPSEVSSNAGVLVYLNVDKRIKDALSQVSKKGGSILEPIHAIGAHGFRAIIKDSEGNRIALHSRTDS